MSAFTEAEYDSSATHIVSVRQSRCPVCHLTPGFQGVNGNGKKSTSLVVPEWPARCFPRRRVPDPVTHPEPKGLEGIVLDGGDVQYL
ncbi:hypothetical protein JZ751_027372 [Albula glossodonta]|uniref:Uncharacterized protein n=1 Tax=Albula glossodonta TaxID=121402 RepID=A0A8T2N0D9_9TELE|nr:hypothetical protein JZ751_027372 [Albula glossodonta]